MPGAYGRGLPRWSAAKGQLNALGREPAELQTVNSAVVIVSFLVSPANTLS